VDNATWIYLTERWSKNFGTQLFKYLPCSQEDSIIPVIFNFLENEKLKQLTQNTTKDYTDSINIFHSFIVKHTKNEAKLFNLLRSLEKIIPK